MAKMTDDWRPLEFTAIECPGKDSYILAGEAVELIQAALDDHVIKAQTMKGSPFAKFMLDDIIAWENTLLKTQDNLDLWLKVQSAWMYLEPVFSSEDIINQMPVEGQKFKEVNIAWHELMNKIHANPAALQVIEIEDLGQTLKAASIKLERVQRGLNDYLESKRALFPRFYFLSNEELLEILSETKEPLRVQPHLKKCFEGIARLKFDDEKKIHGMYSVENELVQFVRVIDPIASKGQVEDWLVQVEDVMLRSVRDRIEKAHQDYTKTVREEWVIKWQGQAVLAIACTYWTVQAEEAMKKNGIQGLKDYYERLCVQLEKTVGVVRTNISNLDRCTLEALIVLDVHAKEVIKNELLDNQICDTNDFKWLSQLRYYWEDNDVWARIINCKLDYNYEYLGNSPRLVITTLTDRCYRTLCGAIYLNYGGAPEGPAGTGKTETVKDLSKALAR
jgi:dynein heavy chain